MRGRDTADLLRQHGIQPSAQRVAIAGYVLNTDSHPTADQVWRKVQTMCPYVSRATVYNTLNLLVRKGLLRHHVFTGAVGIFDPKLDRHHHLMDEETGRVRDIPWDSLRVEGLDSLRDFEITEYTIVLRGRQRKKEG